MAIKLIACDVDGTLLTKEHVLTDKVQKAIQKATAKGVKFCIATGRMFRSAHIFAQKLELDTPVVAYNGGLIKDAKTLEVYKSGLLDKDVAQEVLNLAKENMWYVQKYIDDCFYVKEANGTAQHYAKHVQVPLTAEGEKFYNLTEAPNKLMLVVDPSEKDSISEFLQNKFGNRLFITSSNERFIEIVRPDVNKGCALEYLAQHYNVGLDEVMACGDSFNDLEMLKLAGTSIAMDNAPQAIKDVATYVTKSNEQDGIAVAIEKFIL